MRLTLWLMARYRISLPNVIGHAESLTSRYHRERYAPWRCQTHADWRHADMAVYRRKLAALAAAEHVSARAWRWADRSRCCLEARPRRGRRRGRAPRAARRGDRRGRRPPRRRARRSRRARRRELDRLLSDLARARADAARRAARAVYEPGGRCARPLGDRAPELGREARERAGVTGRPRRADAHEQRVAVAVVAQLDDGERVAGGLALAPEPLARAAPEPRLPRLARQPLGLVVHPGEHQHAAVVASWTIAGLSSGASHRHPQLAQLARAATPSRAGSSCRIDASSAACATPSASATWLRVAGPARRDHRHGTASATAARQLEVVAGTRAVGVDRREQDLARAALAPPRAPSRPRSRPVPACPHASARRRLRRRSRRRPPASRASRRAR